MESPAVPARLIGAIFVERGLVTQEDLDAALAEQAERGGLLGEILVAKYGVSRLELASAIAEQWADLERGESSEIDGATTAPVLSIVQALDAAETEGRRPLGEIFVEQGMITEEELADALRLQKETGERLGEILVARGVISRLELASALADQWASLQKLRPPAPTAAHSEAAPPPTPLSPEPDERVGELADRVAALEQRAASESVGVQPERLDALDAAVRDAEIRFRAALDEIETTRAEGARRLAELAGEMPPLAAEVQGLRARTERLETKADDEVASALEELRARLGEVAARDPDAELRSRIDEIAGRIDELAARPVPDGAAVQALEAGVAELGEAIDQLRARPTIEPQLVGDLQSRLSAVEARSDDDLRGLVEQLERRLAELAGRPMADPAWIEELRLRLEAVEGRSDEELRSVVTEVSARVADLAERPAVEPARVEALRSRLEALEGRSDEEVRAAVAELSERVAELAGRPAADLSQLDELRWRLEALEGRSDEEVRAAVAELALRVAELGDTPAPDLSELQELRSRLEEVESRTDEDLRRRVEELAARQGELAQWTTVEPDGLEELRFRVSQLEQRGDEPSSARLDELQERLEWLAGRPVGESALLDELRSRIEAVEGRGDAELRGLADALSQRLDEIAGRPSVDPAAVDELGSRIAGVEGLGWLVDAVDELRSRLTTVEARNDGELWARLDELHGKLSELSTRPVIESSALVDLQRQIDSIAKSDGPEAREALEAAAALLGRVEALEARGDEELRPWVETIRDRVDELERRPAADTSLPARLDELEERQRVEASGLADRVGEALGALTAWIDALRAAEGEARGVLGDATLRVEELERRAARFDDVERSVAELRDRPAQNEATIALWRAVDTLRGRAEQALTLLGELGSRLESLEAAPPAPSGRATGGESPEPDALPQSPAPAAHVLFVPGGDRYELLERDGAPPSAGEWVELPDGLAALLVTRVGRSPLPGDERPCAFLTP